MPAINTVLFDLDGPLIDSIDLILSTYRHYNLSNHDAMVRAFPRVTELVRAIRARGIRTGVVTSKTREGTRRGLRLVGLEEAIEVMVCADDVTNAKPHPEPVNRAVALLR